MTPSENGNSSEARDVSMDVYHADDEALVRAELSEPDTADYALVTDYLTGEPSPEDRARIEERLRTDPKFRELAEPLISFWKRAGSLEQAFDDDPAETERTVEEFKRRLALQEPGIYSPALEQKRAKRSRRLRTFLGIIAALIGTALLEWRHPTWMPAPQPGALEHTDAPAYEELSTRLPDETQVTLVRGTRLSYSHLISGSLERTLNLDGEGTFVVAPGPGALVVRGHGVQVTAPHGRFTVEAYDALSIAKVTVHEGLAEVHATTKIGDSKSLTLHAGETALVGPGQRIELDDAPLAPNGPKNDGGATTEDAVGQEGFVRGPRDVVDRGRPLVEAIARDFGQRPHELEFVGKDTIDVTFWNAAFWRSDMESTELPQASLPLVRKAAERVGGFVWTDYGRDAGINVIRVTFVRMRRVSTELTTRDVPAQEVTGVLTRKQLESAAPQLVSLTMNQR